MKRTAEQLRHDALEIWQAGLQAVRADVLVHQNVRVQGGALVIGPDRIELAGVNRILVVGAGKAGAGMAAGLEEALGADIMAATQLAGWVHVPEDCLRPLARIHLHVARPAGVNEPTQAGVDGSREMLRLVGELGPRDVCIALISGGGSALLPLPVEGISLADKLAVTRHLSAAGAPIEALNTIRTQLSRIKGGGLARACRAGRMFTLVISDVLGDPLDLIASGPTVESHGTAVEALAVLDRYAGREAGISPHVFDVLNRSIGQAGAPFACQVIHQIIANNATAVEAARRQAAALGYAAASGSASASEGAAEDIGRHLAETAIEMRGAAKTDCLLSGGEPTVKLVEAARRGLGGRNQQLVLAAVERLQADGGQGILILSGGTDGEDGPTDAAGAFADARAIEEGRKLGLEPGEYLRRNDAYHWFEPLGALLKTGPTGTNVCDLRIVLVDRIARD